MTYSYLTVLQTPNGYVNKYAIGSDGNLYRWNLATTSWELDKLSPKK